MEEIVYREFTEADAPGVATMWKDSLSGWPPGFFGASEITVDTVLMEEKMAGRLFTVLALAGDRVVGYCMTSPYGGETDAAYVNLINVVPEMHGRGIGKALLMDSVSRTARMGYYRIDLHTWPANMQAVPLYKKAGFFWVPDTSVYMQNYMPCLLGMPEFRDFLDGEDWYRCFRRELLVEQDRQETDSGREVFTYWFRREDREFLAEFDRSGRILSRIEHPGFAAALEVDSGKEYFVGSDYTATLSGRGFNRSAVRCTTGDSVECQPREECVWTLNPGSVRTARSSYEPADRFMVGIGGNDLSLGLGIHGVEPVALHSEPLLYLEPSKREIHLDLKKLSDIGEIDVEWEIEGIGEGTERLELSREIYQGITLEIPELRPGVHRMNLRIGQDGYPETVAVVSGYYAGPPMVLDTRRSALILGGGIALSVRRKGAGATIWLPGDEGRPRRIGSFFIGAGPPAVWNSDLPKQTYQLEASGDSIRARTDWPSRPGMVHSISIRLDGRGYIEAGSSVHNNSENAGRVSFAAAGRMSGPPEPGSVLVPLPDGLLVERNVINQIPDSAEDYTTSTSTLGAPWLGREKEGIAFMKYFPGWPRMEHYMPATEEADVLPGEKLESPPFKMLLTEEGIGGLLRRAAALGWDTGKTDKRLKFFFHDLAPVMASGSTAELTHPLNGSRKASICLDGNDIASGTVRNGSSIKGPLVGIGTVEVGLTIAGRTILVPVRLVDTGASVNIRRSKNGEMVLSNSVLKATLDPGGCGHVYSVMRDSLEYLHSAHPEPSELCWEKPWFGGIVPRFEPHGHKAYPLEDSEPEVAEFRHSSSGLEEMGFSMKWSVNDKKYGSFELDWRVSLLPGLPVLRTILDYRALSGAHTSGEVDVRGFLQPGGSGEDAVLSCENFPGLAQAREHAGAWADAGRWGRVSREGFFVEAYSRGDGVFYTEDYGKPGCHLTVIDSTDRERSLEMVWLFGSDADDNELSSIFRRHLSV